MLRQIKFRAWHKRTSEMYGVKELDFNQRDGTVSGIVADRGLEWGNVLPVTDFELLQCTGLLDRNGKNIYEGDIVRFKPDADYDIGEVVFGKHNGAFCFSLPHEGIRVPMLNSMCTLSLVASSDFEVIGNVYENPELLPKEH